MDPRSGYILQLCQITSNFSQFYLQKCRVSYAYTYVATNACRQNQEHI